jgi:hypothetical protein
MAKNHSLAHPEPRTMTFVRKTIKIGPYEIDGFMMPNGEFRQGLSSTARAVGSNHQRVSRVIDNLLAAGANPLQRNESHAITGSKTADITKYGSQPVLKLTGRPERLLSLPLAQAAWSYEARYGDGESQEAAWEILEALASVSLERSFQEAFNVEDSRSQDERLIDYFVRLEIGKYRKLFPRQFQIEFKRVSKLDINSPSQAVKPMIANLIYDRLPADVYEVLQERNPADENGRRAHKHHQLLTEDALNEVVKPMVSACTAIMLSETSLKQVNHKMDRIYPPQRGRRVKIGEKHHQQLNLC